MPDMGNYRFFKKKFSLCCSTQKHVFCSRHAVRKWFIQKKNLLFLIQKVTEKKTKSFQGNLIVHSMSSMQELFINWKNFDRFREEVYERFSELIEQTEDERIWWFDIDFDFVLG